MKRFIYICLASCSLGVIAAYGVVSEGGVGDVNADDFSRYGVILQRKPFGEPPPATPPPHLRPKRPEDKFTKYLRMCAITDTELGIRVGFVDIKARPPRSYFLYEGEEEDGIKVVRADYEREEAILMKDGEQAPLYLNGQAAEIKPATSPTSTPMPVRSASRARPSIPAPSKSMSYSERFRLRREALARKIEEDKKKKKTVKAMSSGDRQKFLQEYNMELIRARGKLGPPLPIQLSKEADEQLVKEGVLPPSE
jgi:hypothetical protein